MPLLSHISLYEPYCSAQAEILISRYPTNGVQSKLLVAPGLSVGSHEQLRRLPQQPFEESKVTAADLQNWGEVEGKDHLLEVILQMEDDQGQPQVTFEEALLVAFRDDNNKAIVLITGEVGHPVTASGGSPQLQDNASTDLSACRHAHDATSPAAQICTCQACQTGTRIEASTSRTHAPGSLKLPLTTCCMWCAYTLLHQPMISCHWTRHTVRRMLTF